MVSIHSNPVRGGPGRKPIDDAVWAALNDASRRKILDLLRKKSMTTNELCECFEFSRFAVMKHLTTLQKGGLIVVERSGRERINHLNPIPLQTMYRRWIRPFEQIPADRLLRLKSIAESTTES
ncbi:MAG: metalloregulator ArsR/SmtB family transcription factor [Dehalococcoidia bacterium]